MKCLYFLNVIMFWNDILILITAFFSSQLYIFINLCKM